MSDEKPTTSIDEVFQKGLEQHQNGELTEAEAIYEEVLRQDPDHVDALQLLGVVAAQLGNLELAVQRAREAISKQPDQPVTYNNLGNMLVELDRYDEAVEAYQNAIHLRPDYVQAHSNLGHVHCRADQLIEALAAYQRVTELTPEDENGWDSLGDALYKIGRNEDALEAFQKASALAPERASIMHRIGMVFRNMQRLGEAAEVYQRCLDMNPSDAIAKVYLFVCTQDGEQPERLSEEFVQKTFDDFASTFDTVLTTLKYQVPEILGEMAADFASESEEPLRIVDVGCGTGLCAAKLSSLARRLIGVDLSAGMLARAEQRGVYDELFKVDLTKFLSACGEEFDLVFSADTFIYIGDLRSTFDAAAQRLRAGGAILFSVEKLSEPNGDPEAGYRLGITGRYQHSRGILSSWLDESEFDIREIREAVVRHEGKDEVPGYFVIATRRG